MNHLEKLFFAFPNKSWNYKSLSRNPKLTQAIVNSTPLDKWDLSLLAKNTSIPIDFIKQLANNLTPKTLAILKNVISARPDIDPADCLIYQIDWDHRKINEKFPTINNDFLRIPNYYRYISSVNYDINPDYDIEILCENPALDIDILLEFSEENIGHISKNPSLNNEHIEKHPHNNWQYPYVVESPHIDIKRLLDFLYHDNYDAGSIAEEYASRNPNINFESYLNGDYADYETNISVSSIVADSLKKPNFWDLFQNNHEFRKYFAEYTPNEIILQPGRPITDEQIIASESFLLQDLRNIPNVPTKVFLTYYESFETYQNIILTADVFRQHPDLAKHSSIYKNPTLTWAIIIEVGPIAWNFAELSAHPNINLTIIDNAGKPWNFTKLSANPNLTAHYVIKHADKPWNFKKLSANIFTKNQLVQDLETHESRKIYDLTVHELKMKHRDVANRLTPIISNTK